MKKKIWIGLLLGALFSCTSLDKEQAGQSSGRKIGDPFFTAMEPQQTGIHFVNKLEYDKQFNVYTYRNFYNGGGVAVGDVNNDGWEDIYFTANMGPNRLFLNKGGFKFEEVTEKAGVAGTRAWSTGVAMADVNGDGWLDIYVCNSGDVKGDNRQNELFINGKDGTFSEQAEAYGIADKGLSTHAVFFDYDKDGDLDLYLLNNSFKAIGLFNQQKNERLKRDPVGGDKLFRNNGSQYEDVSAAAGIYGSIIGFGLGVTVGDVNRDGWQDIYISNDFFERDYLYINKRNGTFSEELVKQMRSISAASMGADMGDINNDGYPEIFVTEMLPEKDADIKQKTTFEDWDTYQKNIRNDYYHQFTRNMLQLNHGNGTFSEIGRLAGVAATDWSWGALIFDMDNDGLKDLFVANGIYQDLTDQDYIDFIANENTQRMAITDEGVDFKILIDSIPIRPIPNYAFQNLGGLQFLNKAAEWGLAQPSHSNGSAYADLDNDGDLDLVVNNVNAPAFVYRNEGTNNRFLQISLIGEQQNTAALGAKVTLKHDQKLQYLEHMPMRGFQSSMGYKLHFGVGTAEKIDTVEVEWPNGKLTQLVEVRSNQHLVLKQSDAQEIIQVMVDKTEPIFQDVTSTVDIHFKHIENQFSDFDRDRLIYHMMSSAGPKVAVADINADGLDDFYICGAKDAAGKLFVQDKSGTFLSVQETLFQETALSEEVDCIFFDADNDQDPDLYVACGGNEFPSSSTALIDRLYFNDGTGKFTVSNQILPTFQFESTSCVEAGDYDNDGDQDLLVGIRLRPFLYGTPVNAYILQNNGKGEFVEVTKKIAPDLLNLGMVTDLKWTDFDNDADQDILVVGDWMPITILKNENAVFSRIDLEKLGVGNAKGWWNRIEVADFNEDGKPDYLLGNHGWNSRFKANSETPLVMYINDFDQNGSVEQILARQENGKWLPFVRRHDLGMQLPQMKKRFLRYSSYVGQTVDDVFGKDRLASSIRLEADNLATSLLLSKANGTFELRALPQRAQFSPVYGFFVADIDHDGHSDVLSVGNLYAVKPEMGKYDADYGLVLKGDGAGNFKDMPSKSTGFWVEGEARDIKAITVKGKDLLMVARNNDRLLFFTYNR